MELTTKPFIIKNELERDRVENIFFFSSMVINDMMIMILQPILAQTKGNKVWKPSPPVTLYLGFNVSLSLTFIQCESVLEPVSGSH